MIDILSSILVIVFIVALVLFWLTFFDWYVAVEDFSDNDSIASGLAGFAFKLFSDSVDFLSRFLYRCLEVVDFA
jgi:hypothetical protein